MRPHPGRGGARRYACLLGCLCLFATRPAAGVQQVDTLALESHARFLSDDLLEGRGPASRGERLAALYLSTRLRSFGLETLPGSDYLLPVPLTAVHSPKNETTLSLTGPEGTRAMRPPSFYHPGGGREAFRSFQGELVFAGPTPGALEALADRASLDGRVIVIGPPWDEVQDVETELLRRGAAGALELVPNGPFYDRLRVVRGPTRYFLPEDVRDPLNQSRLPRLVGGPELIAALGLEGDLAPDGPAARARPLELRARFDPRYSLEKRVGYNVAGYVPGSDPARRDELILFVAHYDHVGYGESSAGDSIWNGFVDNAVGCAMLLELARAFASAPSARSVAFLFVTGEEQGLLGSNWFVHDPPIRLERIRAVINLDGGAPPGRPTGWHVAGASVSDAGKVAREIVESHGWAVERVDLRPDSDHWPFHLKGVPAVFLLPGSRLEGLTEQEARERIAARLHPHTPDDEWSPDFPFSGLERYAELALEIGRALAGAPQR